MVPPSALGALVAAGHAPGAKFAVLRAAERDWAVIDPGPAARRRGGSRLSDWRGSRRPRERYVGAGRTAPLPVPCASRRPLVQLRVHGHRVLKPEERMG